MYLFSHHHQLLLVVLLLAPLSALAVTHHELIRPSHALAATASAPTLSALSHTSSGTSQAVGVLVSFTGGRGNYRTMASEFLAAHNEVRAALQERPLKWDRRLTRLARRWSDRRRAECSIQHSMGPYGENMFWGSGWSWRAADVVKEWAREKEFYSMRDNTCTPGKMCGHFTQIIWNSTNRIGCGRSECYTGGVIVTCLYDPPGNYVGESPLTATA